MQEGGKKGSPEKPQRKRVASTELGSEGENPGRFTRWEAWTALEKNTLYFASISIPSTQNQAGSGPVAGLDSLPASQTWGSLTPAPPQGLLLLPYALPLPIHLCFLHFVPIALALGYYIPWGIRKYRKESFLPKPPFSVQSLNSSPREHNEFRGEAQFGLSCCFTRISFWAESLKRDKYT